MALLADRDVLSMWDLDNAQIWRRVACFELPWATTYADTRPGQTDKEKRERIREFASRTLSTSPSDKVSAWAFRIYVRKCGKQPFDIENVPKLIIDAFSARQITRDGSRYANLALYPDDTIDCVVTLQVAGERTAAVDSTVVEVFSRLQLSYLHTSLDR